MSLVSRILEESSYQAEKADQMQRKLLQSKLKGLNDHISALLQKKIRIDLEIKRTKKKLSKLSTQSLTLVKTKVKLEGFDYDRLSQDELESFLEAVGQNEFEDLYNLDEQIFKALNLLSEIEKLPLYED